MGRHGNSCLSLWDSGNRGTLDFEIGYVGSTGGGGEVRVYGP